MITVTSYVVALLQSIVIVKPGDFEGDIDNEHNNNEDDVNNNDILFRLIIIQQDTCRASYRDTFI